MKFTEDNQRTERSRRRTLLMQRLQAGDADACRDLLDDIGPAVTGFLRRRMAASDEIEDVYQEVFMAVFEARHTYESGRSGLRGGALRSPLESPRCSPGTAQIRKSTARLMVALRLPRWRQSWSETIN